MIYKMIDRKKNIAGMILICIVMLIISSFRQPVYADSEDKVVKVGYYENEVFQEGASEGAVKKGYSYEYYLKLSEYTGWKYEYVYGEFGDLYQKLLDGEIDLLAGLAWKEERNGLMGFPELPMGNESYNLVRHDVDTDITTDPTSLNGRTIGVLNSAMVDVLNDYLDERGIKADIVTFDDYEKLFSAFDDHTVDVLAAEGDGAYGRQHAEFLLSFGASDYYLCVNKNRQDLLEELNSAQERLAIDEPNYINTLRTKYYSVSVTARAFSETEREWMDGHDSICVGYLENYLPYSDTDKDGRVTGIIKDILPEIFADIGVKDIDISYIGYKSYDDMIEDMNSDKIDVAFPVGGGLYYSEENGIYQSNPVVSASTELVYKGEYSDKTVTHFAVNENNSMQYYYIKTYFPDAEITKYKSIEDCLDSVLSGDAACTTLNGLRANDILKNYKYKSLSTHQASRSDDICFGIKIGNEGLLKLLNRGLNMVGADYAQNISYRYTEGLYSYGFKDLIREHMAIFGSLLLLFAIIVIALLVRDTKRKKKELRDKEAARQEMEEKNKELANNKEALSEALETAENANRAKTTFLNNMSHDIRTPMNAIVGFTTLAEENIDDREKVQDYLGKISVSSQHLLSLINDVLDMSRIESGKVTIEENNVHLPDVISDVGNIVQPNAGSKQIDFTMDSEGIVHEDIITDKMRLNQVLLNILSNAIKFTPNGGRVSCMVTEKKCEDPERTTIVFDVKDNGIGMSEEFRKTIFEAFTREKTSTVSGIQGTGLGMAITKNIVDMMGGTIDVYSEEGRGSEFIVEIPCRIGETENRSSTDSEMPDFSGHRVLLVEDNEMNQLIAMEILKDFGLEVDIASDGTEAVKTVEEADGVIYDVILMDIQMPKMDGYEATRIIRNMGGGKARIPIVAVTANAFEEDKQLAENAGMNGHLAKPYDIPEMIHTLKGILLEKTIS